MCKVGIFLIGIDLYHSTSTLFQKLILHKTGSYLDLIVHIIGLMTLLLAYRGRVKRNIAGKVVLPVMIVNGFKQLVAGQFVTFVDNSTLQAEDYDGGDNAAGMIQFDKLRFFDNPHVDNVERLMVVKTLLFVMVMAKLAFQGDDSCVGENEWFPWQQQESANVVENKSEVKKKD